jgi:hypothetical protein
MAALIRKIAIAVLGANRPGCMILFSGIACMNNSSMPKSTPGMYSAKVRKEMANAIKLLTIAIWRNLRSSASRPIAESIRQSAVLNFIGE